jgi:replication initiation and membrane attachment protein DnaB
MALTRMVNGVEIELTAEEEAAKRAEWAANKAEREATKYSRDRQSAYPNWPDQLDQIYHEGIDAWKASIKKIKDDNPKP